MDVEGVNKTQASLPSTGTVVGGKYHLESYIAEGGMAVIARGRHIELDEPIALKFLKPEVVASDTTGTLCGRFVREARATIKIRSEHVPRIFDVSTLPTGLPYIVMELLAGEDLDRRLDNEGPLRIAFVVDTVLQSLEALAAAHALGMVHRDFKPANLFLSKRLDGSDCVKVLDFGIAKLVDDGAAGDQGLTTTSAVIGSPRYMAPEQMRSSHDVDARADIWAVGATLYELLTGTPSFDGNNLTHVCAAILQDEPVPIAAKRSDVPPSLEAVVRRCLAKSPSERYGSVADLAAALAPFGTAPAADEAAQRVARVLGVAPRSDSGAEGSLGRRGSNPSGLGSGATSTAWGPMNMPSHVGRRTIWMLACAIAVLVVVGAVLIGVTLSRSRASSAVTASSAGGAETPAVTPSAPLVASSAGAVDSVASSSAPAIVSAPMEIARPSSTEPKVSSPADARSLTKTVPEPKVSSPADARSQTKLVPEPKVSSPADARSQTKLVPEPKESAPADARSQTKPTRPTTSPSGGGLWDDRK